MSAPPAKKAKTENGTMASTSNGSTPTTPGTADGHFDHALYSRQFYALGETAMRRLRTASVLVSGLDGVGVEVAKNLVLGGIRHVTLHDTKVAGPHDLHANYYLKPDSLQKNRAELCKEAIAELNDSVTVALMTEPLTEQLVAKFDLVVLCDSGFDHAKTVNGWTRAHKRKFLLADSRGLFAYIFNDFNQAHRVDDADGEQTNDVMVEHIDKGTGLVICLEDARHGLEDGDAVSFSEVKGLTGLNEHPAPLNVKVKNPTQFTLEPESLAKFEGQYQEGGRFKKVKQPKDVEFKSLPESMEKPEFVLSDFAKMERPAEALEAWKALYSFEQAKGRRPQPKDQADLDGFKEKLGQAKVPDEVVEGFVRGSCGQVSAVTGFIGAVAAQEAMKGVSGLYMPIRQWLLYDALEAVPGAWSEFDAAKLTAEKCAAKGSRYDGIAAVFGWDFLAALQKQKVFTVGAGAIGCELLKYYATLGVGCQAQGGSITITDMDRIELSNLNRQFLFRRHDVGNLKSETAAKAAREFNGELAVRALSERVGSDTERTFDDTFFQGLTVVANALDNIDARRYMDRRCVYYALPLLESGTMGPKGNTQVVYPYLTESYSDTQDPPEASIPICTLKNFPNAIEHTIQWARDAFEGLFSNPAEIANQFLEDQRIFLQRLDKMHTGQQKEMLEAVVKALKEERPSSVDDCIKWARLLFEEYFSNSIRQLLHNFPADQMTAAGVKFWSGAKRCPAPLTFDANNAEHLDFVYAGAILRAQLYNIPFTLTREQVAAKSGEVEIPEFKPADGLRIATTDAEAKQQVEEAQNGGNPDDSNERSVAQLKLAKLRPNNLIALRAVEFEKDDDSNHHMEWITACSNLRAANYRIPPSDRIATKKIAGRIIPALATTTAAVAGLVAVELLKMVAGGSERKTPLEVFKNGFINLALPFIAFSEPIAVPKKKYLDNEFTIWDSIKLSGPMTLQQIKDHFKAQNEKLDLSMLSCGSALIYSSFLPPARQNERLAMDLRQAVEKVTGRELAPHLRVIVLEPMFDEVDGVDIETPYIKFTL